MTRILLGISLLIGIGCDHSDSSFTRDAGQQQELQETKNTPARNAAENEVTSESDPTPTPIEETKNTYSEPERKQKCWFAVSGTWVGYPDYHGVFPLTQSGAPIEHGQIFDDVGGIFLEAREAAYEYGKDGKEIDRAIDYTFDSIVVAPDMSVRIQKADGTLIWEGAGPLVAESSFNASIPAWNGVYFNHLKNRTDLPPWMMDYLARRSALEVIDLHPARSVKVSAVPGTPCDS